MKNKDLYFAWGFFYILCAILGFIQEPAEIVRALLFLLSVAFFVPGIWLLIRYQKAGDMQGLKIIRNLSIAALSLDVILLLVNILSYELSRAAGDVLYGILTVFASPMVCSQFWVMPLFLWAVLLLWSKQALKAIKN